MKIVVTDQKGAVHEVDAPVGWTLMEAVRNANLPLKAECGGCLACATCHVYVDDKWTGSIPAAGDIEISMLDMAFEVQDNSRLSCQIVLKPEHEGFAVTLAPGTD